MSQGGEVSFEPIKCHLIKFHDLMFPVSSVSWRCILAKVGHGDAD